MTSVNFTIESNFEEKAEKAIRSVINKQIPMSKKVNPKNIIPISLQIPEEILNSKDTDALSKFALETYGRGVDRRFRWEKALKTAKSMQRKLVKQDLIKQDLAEQDLIEQPLAKQHLIEQPLTGNKQHEERNDVMDKRKWPWIEGYSFHCDGPNATTQNNCYIKSHTSGLEFCCMEKELPSYLEKGFDIPSAQLSSENVGVRPEKKIIPKKTTTKPVVTKPVVTKAVDPEPVEKPKQEEIPAPIVARETNIPIDKGPDNP